MDINHNLTQILNDLIKVNNDRIEGYQKAIEELSDKDIDLKAIFSRMVDESRRNVAELSREVYRLGEEPGIASQSLTGKIYQAWTNFKLAFSGSSRLAMLESCETGEDAAQNIYRQALVSGEIISIDIRQMIAKQKETLKVSHDTVSRFLELHKKAESDDITVSDQLRSSGSDLRNNQYL